MNPYDANTHPGEHLVAETLGVSDVSTLDVIHHPDEPLHRAATRVIEAAYDLDQRHDQVTDAGKHALRLIEPVAHGNLRGARVSYALLRTAVPELGDVLAQQNRAYTQLVEAITAYRHLLPRPVAAGRSASERVFEPSSGQHSVPVGDWAIAGDRQLRALEAVEVGGLRLCRTGIGEDPYLSDGTGLRPKPLAETVRRLVANGLLHQDTAENPYRPGHLLTLTSAGEAALREARSTTPQVSAALSRSNAPARPGTVADSAVLPVATAVVKPARSR
ncbi:large ATP-binding protein [Streptomyces sp. NPDC003435]